MTRARDLASGNSYKVGEVVQKKWASTSTAYDISDSTNFTTILSLSFTPRFSTSKILLSCDLAFGKRGSGELQFNHRFTRNGTAVTTPLTSNATGASYDIFRINTGIGWHSHNMYFGEDVPNLTSEITYAFQVIKQNPGGYDNVAVNFGSLGKTALIIEEIYNG
jgi:hypothetical protein